MVVRGKPSPWHRWSAVVLIFSFVLLMTGCRTSPPSPPTITDLAPLAPDPSELAARDRAEPTGARDDEAPPEGTGRRFEGATTAAIASRASRMTVFIKSGGAYGAGVLMDDAGHILTCDHVVGDADGVTVRFETDSEPRTARLIGRDAQMDLAILRLTDPVPEKAQPALAHPLGTTLELERGQPLYAMGSPRKMSFSFHRGMVSYVGRSFDGVRFIQTDLPMNPGSSGGPVFDQRGRIVGIASFIIRDGQGLSFALPIDYALRRFAELGEVTEHADRFAAFERWLADPTERASDEAEVAPASSPR